MSINITTFFYIYTPTYYRVIRVKENNYFFSDYKKVAGKTIIFSFPRIMISKRGPKRGSYIGGKSVDNQRIDGCTGFMYELFKYMEGEVT